MKNITPQRIKEHDLNCAKKRKKGPWGIKAIKKRGNIYGVCTKCGFVLEYFKAKRVIGNE